jgi:hypothetical protein
MVVVRQGLFDEFDSVSLVTDEPHVLIDDELMINAFNPSRSCSLGKELFHVLINEHAR